MDQEIIIKYAKLEPYLYMKNSHQHNFYEIYYLQAGHRRFFVKDTIYSLQKGDIVLINKGVLHKTTYDSHKSHQRFVIYISSLYMEQLFHIFGKDNINECFNNPYMALIPNQREYMENLLWKMHHEYIEQHKYADTLIKSCLNELLIFLLRYNKQYLPTTKTKISNSDMLCQQAAKYIFKNYQKPLTLGEVADYVGLSHAYFSKKFMQDTGFGFLEYLSHVRMKNACDLLTQTKKPITEIAFLCGYNDSNYFGDVFRKYKGISPSKYRKEHHKASSLLT